MVVNIQLLYEVDIKNLDKDFILELFKDGLYKKDNVGKYYVVIIVGNLKIIIDIFYN